MHRPRCVGLTTCKLAKLAFPMANLQFIIRKYYLLLELEAEVVLVFNELVFAPIVEVGVAKECERPE
jgi:hypothetical protein